MKDKKSIKFLPNYFHSEKNEKFLSNTLDHFIKNPELERIDGFVGAKGIINYDPEQDIYLSETSKIKEYYQLEPAAVFRNESGDITDVVSYDDLASDISKYQNDSLNLLVSDTFQLQKDSIFRNLRTLLSAILIYNPRIDYDKLINFDQYYWIPEGPDAILVTATNNVYSQIIDQQNYTMPNGYKLSNGMKIIFTRDHVSGSNVLNSNTEYIVEGVGKGITLIDFNLLTPPVELCTIFNETFDNINFDDLPFDSDKPFALKHDYITINKASKDLNPWTRYNRWFHLDVLKTTSEINNTELNISIDDRAKRPIIEFLPNIQLYNFGIKGLTNIELIDNNTTLPFVDIENSLGYYIDGVLLSDGYRIIFNNASDKFIRNKIYRVKFNTATNIINLLEDVSSRASDKDSVSVNLGDQFAGSSFYYNEIEKKWIKAQSHTKHNQSPLFDLFDENGKSFSTDISNNNFTGNKIFSYKEGNGSVDDVLGFSLDLGVNFVGVGSYLFRNDFSNNSFEIIKNNQSIKVDTATCFFKINNQLQNVFTTGTDVTLQIPRFKQELLINETTSSVVFSALYPYPDTVVNLTASLTSLNDFSALVNGEFARISTTVSNRKLYYNFEKPLQKNDYVSLLNIAILPRGSVTPENFNLGYYETTLGLTNNPLNEKIETITFSQMSDHVYSMLERYNLNLFKGSFPGSNNLRDLEDISRFGTKLISNRSPISFVYPFISKDEHNFFDAVNFVAEEYNSWKQKFLNTISKINFNTLDVRDIVDSALIELNSNFSSENLFYLSDMIPYGSNKTIKTFNVVSISNNEFPIDIEFDLSKLSFVAILIYKNSIQMTYELDYVFNIVNNSVEIISDLAINDKIEIHSFKDTRGSFVPPTPSKLGLYPKYEPKLVVDDRFYSGSQLMIQGHDGSLTKAFNDYRDDVIVELEKRIYNNIKVFYNQDRDGMPKNLWPHAFTILGYNRAAFNALLSSDFYKWAISNNLDYKTNTTNADSFKGYNWRKASWSPNAYAINGFLNPSVIEQLNTPNNAPNGTYRSLLYFLFNTDRPHTHPWECLGFSNKPIWWAKFYGEPPYSSNNTTLWQDIQSGYVREGIFEGIIPRFVRPNLIVNNLIPVDEAGNIRDPRDYLLYDNSDSDKKGDWEFGDFGPVEVTWRNSSYFPFAIVSLSANLIPTTIFSNFFDVSRTKVNVVGQQVWSEDNLYLDPRKLLIEGYNVEQIAGFGNFIIEYGKSKNPNYLEKLYTDLKYLNFNLIYKLGGYTSKDKLTIKINAVDPDSTSPGLILPQEDYNLVLYKNNVETIYLSGIIIQKKNGKYLLNGYSRKTNVFNFLKPKNTSQTVRLQVGGKSEDYVMWQPYLGDANSGLSSINIATNTKFYKQGQIVYYNQKYYRVAISHAASKTFDTSFFVQLPSLPTVGGISVNLSKDFESTISQIKYNSAFDSIQEVFDIIIGYGKYLETKGFTFENYNSDLEETVNWLFSAKEFLFWATHNWADGNIITLSPFAQQITFSLNNSSFGPLNNTISYSVSNANGQVIPLQNINVVRNEDNCVISTINTEDGIFYVEIDLIAKQHGIVINNTTIFNDTIYDPSSGYRQKRIKLSGFRTKNWNGNLTSPGFLFDPATVLEWEPYTRYYPSQVVRFNGDFYSVKELIINEKTFDFLKFTLLSDKPKAKLLPNLEYKISQFEDFYSLDIDNFDIGQQNLAKGLIGFSSRSYLDKLIPDATAQYKFYQGFIKEKGTKKPLDKIIKYNKNIVTGIEIKEEWAFRIGSFGAENSLRDIEIKLEESLDSENPYILKITNTLTQSNLVHNIDENKILIFPKDFDIDNVFQTESGTFKYNLFKLLNAGYVRIDDVTATAYNKNSLLDIANNSLLNNGDTIWLGFLENGGWDVYRYSIKQAKIKGVFVSSPGTEITFVTDINHNLSIGNIISVIRFSPQVDGVYIVSSIPRSNQFSVRSELVSITNEVLEYYGSLFSFESVRFTDFDALSNNKELIFYDYKSKIWIDEDLDRTWKVLEKTTNFKESIEYSFGNLPVYQGAGSNILINDNSKTIIISSPTNFPRRFFGIQYGKVSIGEKDKNNKLTFYFDYNLNSRSGNDTAFCQPNTSTEFGYALAYDIDKDLFIVGAPAASKVRAVSTSSILVPFAQSTLTARTSLVEGLVKFSQRNQTNSGELTSCVLAQPFVSNLNDSRFGHSLYINQVSKNSSTTLLIGAPGIGSGTVFAYKFDQSINITPFSTSGINQVSLITAPVSTSSFVYVTFSAPNIVGGTTATGIAVKSLGGLTVTNVLITDRGSGYTSPPTVTFTGSFMSVVGQATATIGVIKLEGTYTVVLSQGASWGHKIDGSESGNDIGVGAYKHSYNSGYSGIIQIFDKNLYWKQTITSPFKKYEDFGYDFKVSKSGKFLFASSVNASSSFNTFGKVAIYQKDEFDAYQLSQILENPIPNSDLKFGESISINGNETVLAISSLGTNRSEIVKFFQNKSNLRGETTFDNKETRFITSVPDAGAVYIYNNFGDKFIQAEELVPKDIFIGGQYGKKVVSLNDNIFVGAPFNNNLPTELDKSRFYQFQVKDTNSLSWKVIRNQEELVDCYTFRKISLIDLKNDEVIDYLDIFDPLKGKVPGIAEQELKFKSTVDPAVYSIGINGLTVDSETNWLDAQVGNLWWDLSTAKYIWYEQGDEVFKKNNWGKLFPGASIDIYEWVKSSYLPSEWASLADTNQGLAKGVSGQPKFPDNSVLSVKQVLNSVTGSFENVYYFWVKNKSILPNVKFRKITAAQVSQYISDPLGTGLKFVEFLGKNSFALGNSQNLISGKETSININFDTLKNNIPLHTEWLLMSEGDETRLPNDLLDKKLIDSLLGRDEIGNQVPEKGLNSRNRYGLGIRPRQTLFKNRFAALRNTFSFVNNKLATTPITGSYSFDNLNSIEQIPNVELGEYDFIIDDNDQLQEISTDFFKQAEAICNVVNGKIVSVTIISQGYGYKFPPKIDIIYQGSHTGVLKTSINTVGQVNNIQIENSGGQYIIPPILKIRPHTVLILLDKTANNRWTLNQFNYTLSNWNKVRTQLFNTPLYWDYVDYISENLKEYKPFNYIIDNVFELAKLENVSIGDYIKINNVGDNRYVVLERVSSDGNFDLNYNLMFSQNGTIQFKSTLWDVVDAKYAYDSLTLDESLYDQLPDLELSNILKALKNDIFVDDLKVNWNLLFFNSVKFALTEQRNLDWAFKTSFINVKANISELDQAPAYRVDNSEFIQDFIREIKPYHTKIRNFTAGYETFDIADLNVSDFDLPSFYNQDNERFETVEIQINTGLIKYINTGNNLLNVYPYTNWAGDFKYFVKEIVIGDGGEGYTQRPTVVFQAQNTGPGFRLPVAEAYIRNGKIYRVIVIDSGANLIGNDRGPVRVEFSGGGQVSRTARASVILENETTRKNLISLRFDRNSRQGEIGDRIVTFTTTTDGSSQAYDLPFLANADKSTIIPTLAKKLILSKNYDIVDYSDGTIIGKNRSRFVFNNGAPLAGLELKVTFQKGIKLFNAIDRIQYHYEPTYTMPGKQVNLLMYGMEYPGNLIQALPFNHSVPLLGTETVSTTIFDNGGGFDNFVDFYARNKLINSLERSTTTLVLSSVAGIVTGQTLNFLHVNTLTSGTVFRTDTVVQSIITAQNRVIISSPSYTIRSAVSTNTIIGSSIRIETINPFYGAVRKNDTIEISGIATQGFNQISTITSIESNNSFYIQSSQVLSNIESTTTNTSSFRVYSILQDVQVNNKKLDTFNFYVGECKFPEFDLETSSTFITEGYTATFVISGSNVEFGAGRTFAYNITTAPDSQAGAVSAGEFAAGLSGIITNSALALPITFNLTTLETVFDNTIPKRFDVNLLSYITAGPVSSVPVATKRMSLFRKSLLTATYTISLIDYQGNPVSSAVEGDVVYAVVTATTATNVDFGSNGRVYQLVATGTNINNEIIFSQPTTDIIIKQASDLPITFAVQLREDFTTEGLEKLYLNLMTYQNVIQGTNTNYLATATLNIIDTSQTGAATYQLFSSATSIYEGSTSSIFLKTINIPVGTQIAWTLTQQLGNLTLNDITINGIATTTYTGTFVMVDGAPLYTGFQIGEVKLGTLPDISGEGFEPLETFRLSLIGNTSTFIDIDVRDSIVPFFGNKDLWSYSYSGNKAFTRVRILNSGTFALENSPYGMSPSTKPNDLNEKYSLNFAGLTSLYVRATIEPTDSLWQGNISITGPGFASPITASNVVLNGFSPIQGSWVTVSAAESYTSGGEYGWYASGSYTTSTGLAAIAGFNLTIELSTASGGPVIVSGSYRCRVSSVGALI